MQAVVLGAGLMGRAIAFDLIHHCSFNTVTLADKSPQALSEAEAVIDNSHLKILLVDIDNSAQIKTIIQSADVLISAVPYFYNLQLTKQCIEMGCHFIDLGGNNTVVEKQRNLYDKAKKNQVTVIADSGLAPGLVSVITRDIIEKSDTVESVRLRVGGLPVHPQPPLNYELVFSANGLINEYVEPALVLEQGKIVEKPSMTEIETLKFPDPFGEMEAFITSGGSSTLPYTYQDKIQYLDYKTIRYPGHCEKMKTLLDLGFGSTESTAVNSVKVVPKQVLITLLKKHLPSSQQDVVLLRVKSNVKKKNALFELTYELIDYFEKKTGFTAMMRTTGFPVSITADFIARNVITNHGVFCPEEIIPPQPFFDELRKRNIDITIIERNLNEE